MAELSSYESVAITHVLGELVLAHREEIDRVLHAMGIYIPIENVIQPALTEYRDDEERYHVEQVAKFYQEAHPIWQRDETTDGGWLGEPLPQGLGGQVVDAINTYREGI